MIRIWFFLQPYNRETPFGLLVEGLEPGWPVLVDLQLRPQETEHLAYALGVPALSASQIIHGHGGVEIPDSLFAGADRHQLETNTPLWFYVLREAEFGGKNRLPGVGAIVVAETFHRAMQASTHSIVNDAAFRPTLGPGVSQGRFDMADLLHYAFEGKEEMLNPH